MEHGHVLDGEGFQVGLADIPRLELEVEVDLQDN